MLPTLPKHFMAGTSFLVYEKQTCCQTCVPTNGIAFDVKGIFHKVKRFPRYAALLYSTNDKIRLCGSLAASL